MASSRISENLPPNIDRTRATLAYGRWAINRLNRELKSDELIVRQRAVNALSDYLHDHEHIVEAIREGIVDSLKGLLKDKDETCRQIAIKCLHVLSMHAVGRQAFIDKQIIVPLAECFDDSSDVCRLNTHLAMEMISEGPIGADGILEAALIPRLIVKAANELDEIKCHILSTLHFCSRFDPKPALSSNGMEVFTNLLSHKNAEIRGKAALCILDISVPNEGKEKAIDCETVPALIALLQDNTAEVRASVTGALAMIGIITLGKYTILNAGAIPLLLPLVDDANSEVRSNALKCLTCLAETPEGRKIMLEHVEKIRARILDQISAVSKHAHICVKVIEWRP